MARKIETVLVGGDYWKYPCRVVGRIGEWVVCWDPSAVDPDGTLKPSARAKKHYFAVARTGFVVEGHPLAQRLASRLTEWQALRLALTVAPLPSRREAAAEAWASFDARTLPADAQPDTRILYEWARYAYDLAPKDHTEAIGLRRHYLWRLERETEIERQETVLCRLALLENFAGKEVASGN